MSPGVWEAQPLDGPPQWAEVALSVYELNGLSALSQMTERLGWGRAQHVGVEVYWLEWSFGWCEEGPGVYCVLPRTSALGSFHTRVPLGRTPLSPHQVIRLLERFRRTWHGDGYDVLRRNCAHFSVELVKQLKVNEAPAWVNSLANIGDRMVQQIGVARAEEAAAAATPAPEHRLAPPLQDFGSDSEDSDAEESDRHKRERTWQDAKEFVQQHARTAESQSRFIEHAFDVQFGGQGASAAAGNLLDFLISDRYFHEAVEDSTAAGLQRDFEVCEEWQPVEVVGLYKRDQLRMRVRTRIYSTGEKEAWPPAVPAAKEFGRAFCFEMRRAALRGSAADWPQGAADLVSTVEVLAAPGHAPVGLRAMTPAGPTGAVIFAQPREDSRSAGHGDGADLLSRLEELQRQHRQLLETSKAVAALQPGPPEPAWERRLPPTALLGSAPPLYSGWGAPVGLEAAHPALADTLARFHNLRQRVAL